MHSQFQELHIIRKAAHLSFFRQSFLQNAPAPPTSRQFERFYNLDTASNSRNTITYSYKNMKTTIIYLTNTE